MKKHITYAHMRYLQSRKRCSETALSIGGMDVSVPCGLDDIDPEFIRAHRSIFLQPRGAGYWIWKPYLILKHLVALSDEDWLMYTDAGMYFRKSPWELILAHASSIGEQGVMTFGWCGANKEYCKRDAFVLMGLDTPHFTDTLQCGAGVFVCRKTAFSIRFVQEWLQYACDPRIITDMPNTQGLPNYPEFKDHRHDQSILSLLVRKYEITLLDDLTQWSSRPDPYLFNARDPN